NYFKSVAAEIANIDCVTEFRDCEVETELIFKLADLVRTWVLAATGLLLFTSVFLIYNTIRIKIIYSRREIQIILLVGDKK
ncbi:cell division protein FtsX, partial [Streptococcus suis]